jgi:Leucine-rich repeat (LRR) protein
LSFFDGTNNSEEVFKLKFSNCEENLRLRPKELDKSIIFFVTYKRYGNCVFICSSNDSHFSLFLTTFFVRRYEVMQWFTPSTPVLERHLTLSVFAILFATILITSPLSAQEASLLDSAALAQKKEFTSLDEALKNPAAVYRLDLSFSGLAEFPQEIVQFKNLQSLNLSNNGMSAIPSDIAKLTKLQRLNLATNGLKRLPTEIVSLKHLKWVDISQNQFMTSELTKLKAALPQVFIND